MVHENRTEEYMQKGEEYLQKGKEMGKEMYSQAQHKAEDAFQATQDVVREYPIAATLTVFSVGVGLGLLATSLLMPRRREWYEPYADSSTYRHMADNACRTIADSIARMMPESIKSKMS